MVFPLTEHESIGFFRQCCRPGGPLSRQNGESMKQCVSRRRRCWTLLTQLDPVIHLSEGHRSDILLDLSSLTREERVMVQALINNERDFDRVADALIIQHPRIHLRESRKRAKGKGKDGIKRGDNSNTHWFQEKGKHIGSENSGANANCGIFTSVEDYGCEDDTPPGLSLEVTSEKKTQDCDDDKENDTFSSYVALDDVTVFEAPGLDAIPLLTDTWDKRS